VVAPWSKPPQRDSKDGKDLKGNKDEELTQKKNCLPEKSAPYIGSG